MTNVLEAYKKRAEKNALLVFFYNANFNANNVEFFRLYLLSIVASLSDYPIEGFTFRDASAITLFGYELQNLYLTCRDALSMIPNRVHEYDIVEFEKITDSVSAVPKAFFKRVTEAYNSRIKELEEVALTSTTDGSFSGQFVVQNDKIIDLHTSYGSIIGQAFSFVQIPVDLTVKRDNNGVV